MSEEPLKLHALCNQQQSIETFSFNGELYRGDCERLIDEYNITKPSKKFRTWLIDMDLKIEKNVHESKLKAVEMPSEEDFNSEYRELPFTNGLDDGQYNDGVLTGFEMCWEWIKSLNK